MIVRMCLGGCGRRVTKGRCAGCRAAFERMRGTPAQRGYGTNHQNARAALAKTLPTPCGYCGAMISGGKWVAAHVMDGDPSFGWMVSHPACNERAKGRYRATATPGLDRVRL